MQQQVKKEPIRAEAVQLQRALDGRANAALWRAAAGMAISLALACLIVMLEFTGQAAHRADRLNRFAGGLLSKISRLEARVAAEHARITAARRELAAADMVRALLRAPDAGMLRLSPPAAGGLKAAQAHRPEAVLALSPREHRAVLMVAGLKPPANDTLYVLWLSASHGAPRRAAEFRTAADGSALVTAALPPALEVTVATVTAERAAKGGAAKDAAEGSAQAAPAGLVQLRGTLAR